MNTLGARAIDRRTGTGRALAAWRSALVRDLGGQVSTQQEALVDLACRTRLMLDSIDGWLLSQPSLVDKRHRRLLPVVKERQALADALARYLSMLGLQRVAAPVPSLQDFLAEAAEEEAQADDAEPEAEEGNRAP